MAHMNKKLNDDKKHAPPAEKTEFLKLVTRLSHVKGFKAVLYDGGSTVDMSYIYERSVFGIPSAHPTERIALNSRLTPDDDGQIKFQQHQIMISTHDKYGSTCAPDRSVESYAELAAVLKEWAQKVLGIDPELESRLAAAFNGAAPMEKELDIPSMAAEERTLPPRPEKVRLSTGPGTRRRAPTSSRPSPRR